MLDWINHRPTTDKSAVCVQQIALDDITGLMASIASDRTCSDGEY